METDRKTRPILLKRKTSRINDILIDNSSNRLSDKCHKLRDGCNESSDSSGQPKLTGNQRVFAPNVLLSSSPTTALSTRSNQPVTLSDTAVAAATSAANIQLPVNMPQSPGQLTVNPVQDVNDWRESISTPGLRNHLVLQFVQKIHPTINDETILDERLNSFITFVRKFEDRIYKKSESILDYYFSLAEKIYEIQQKIEKEDPKQKQILEHLQQQSSQPCALPIVNPACPSPRKVVPNLRSPGTGQLENLRLGMQRKRTECPQQQQKQQRSAMPDSPTGPFIDLINKKP